MLTLRLEIDKNGGAKNSLSYQDEDGVMHRVAPAGSVNFSSIVQYMKKRGWSVEYFYNPDSGEEYFVFHHPNLEPSEELPT